MDTKTFFEHDFPASLYPMKTNLLLIQNHHQALDKYIAKILSDDPAYLGDSFLPQTRVHAAKPRSHLRRTTILDPVASYFLYDLIYRNRQAFGKPVSSARRTFGYRFEGGQPLSVHKAYKDFTDNVQFSHGFEYEHMISFDIASYFNSIYHHDATNWFASLSGVSGTDVNAFGRFFREINAGRSIDFLPQGIYPAKMIGSEFLKFIELSGQIKSKQTFRFMDDIYLFDDDKKTLIQDFLRIQELLGLRALNVNPTKTIVDGEKITVSEAASVIKQELEDLIEDLDETEMYLGSGIDGSSFEEDEDEDEDEDEVTLNDEQIERLLELLVDSRAEESDVELILGILHEHTESLSSHIPGLIAKFPNIIKQLHKLVGQISAKDDVTDHLLVLVDAEASLLEYQLFWIAVIAEDHLSKTKNFGKLVLRLYERTASHKIARAKILEIPDQSFGLKEIRDEVLKSGTSDWLSWASAVGTRTLNKAERNYVLKYFSKGSPINFLIAECVQNL